VSARNPAEQRGEKTPPPALCGCVRVEERRGFGEALAFQLRRRVHADHAPLVDLPSSPWSARQASGKRFRHPEPVKENRLVAGKIFLSSSAREGCNRSIFASVELMSITSILPAAIAS